jgi:hypothetical protein
MSDAAQPPHPLRVPATVALAVLALPLALPAWILLSGSRRAIYWRSPWVRWGLWIFVASTLPLAAAILFSGPGANPIGLGLLFLAGLAAGSALALIGVVCAQ